jgi:hypothetical protein
MSLIRGYYGIRDPQLQADILRLITRLAGRDDERGGRPLSAHLDVG